MLVTGGNSVQIIWGVTAVAFVGIGLLARRLPIGPTLKMIFAWSAIFVAAFVLASYRDSFQRVWTHVRAEFSPGGSVDQNGSVRVKMSDDGHFWVDTKINGLPMRLMVDSGATQTSIGTAAALSLDIAIDRSGRSVPVDTANGTVTAYPAQIRLLTVGPIKRSDFGILVSDSFGDTNVIGMDFLTSLDGWRVEGRDLILNPK
jgi:aspartyl protease family protein